MKTISKEDSTAIIFNSNIVSEIGNNIISIFQDKNNNYWFGTQGSGVYRYDGKNLLHFSEKDGLNNNQIQTIQEDKAGNIWFGTGGFGVCRFNGKTFSTFTHKDSLKANSNLSKEWKIETDDLWFNAGGGVYRYNGKSLIYLPLPKTDFDTKYSQKPADRLSAYAVYCTLKDRKGNLWLGTQTMGVCCYDGKSFTWFNEKGLGGSAVLGIFEYRNGDLWFGNNGSGLFRLDYQKSASEMNKNNGQLSNLTEEKGLSNIEFKKSGKSGPGTMARIYSISEDTYGGLWVGTVDAGAWRYDGKNLINFTTKDGLSSDAVTCIYKDKSGELWFGTEGKGVNKFNGRSFIKFVFN